MLHKTQPGPVPAFQVLAPKLLRTYDAITAWRAMAGPALTVRRFDGGTEIVGDFCAATGLQIAAEPVRHQARAEPTEMLLRGLYNDRFKGPVMPGQFNATVLKAMQRPVPSVARMAALAGDQAELEEIIAAKGDTFAFIAAEFGIDLLAAPEAEARPAASAIPEGLDDPARLIDFLVELTLAQSIRITRLESAVDALTQSLAERS